MLVLSRKPGESIIINGDIKITVVQTKGNQVKVGIEAPKETKIYREELLKSMQETNPENKKASGE